MNENMRLIMEEIKLGTRKDLNDINFSCEEYFTEVNGEPFLEYLLKNKIDISVADKLSLKNSMEAAYLFVKYGQSINYFELTEKQIFSSYNGERFIDFISKNVEDLLPGIIRNVKNNVEIIDIIISSGEYFNFYYISDELMDKLLSKDENGKYFVEKYLDDLGSAAIILIESVKQPKVMLELAAKYNCVFDIVKRNERKLENIDTNLLMSEISDNKTGLQILLRNHIIPNVLESIPKDIKFINFLRQKGFYEFLRNSPEDVLLLEIEKDPNSLENGKTLLEDICEKKQLFEVNDTISNKKSISILNSYNKLDCITNCSQELLVTPISEIFEDSSVQNDKLLIEYMLDKGINPLVESTFKIDDERIIRVLFSKGYSSFLYERIEPHKLLTQLEDSAILDYLLEDIKSNKVTYDLKEIIKSASSIGDIAKYYIIFAKHGMISKLAPLQVDDLLKKSVDGKTLLEQLLDLDSNITLKYIINEDIKSNIEIASILYSRGLILNDRNVKLYVEKTNFSNKYLESAIKKSGIGPLPEEGENLLKELSDLFMMDGKSDHSLISGLVSGYRRALIVNYKASVQELKNLIEVKRNNYKKFVYVKDKEGGFFNTSKGYVNCDRERIETLMHETGHALHYYLTNDKVPEEYSSIVERVRTNPENLKKIEEFDNYNQKITQKVYSIAKKESDSFFELYYDSEQKNSIQKFLNKFKNEKIQEFKFLGLLNKGLEKIIDKLFNKEIQVDEYINHQKSIFIRERISDIRKVEFYEVYAISDILDAIYEGKIFDGKLQDSSGLKIRGAGHGSNYYSKSRTEYGFYEMVANFAELVKSHYAQDYLMMLKNIVGDELYNMLSEFYYGNIVLNKNNEIENEKEESKSL